MRRSMLSVSRAGFILSTMIALPVFAQTQSCNVRSGATVAPVVELYTSEGCSSCPPADQWLSALGSNADVVASAFHVDYWDYLGWKDRFASRAHTQRQSSEQARNGAGYSYTPQVVIDGADAKRWYNVKPASTARPKSAVDITLTGAANRFSAQVRPVGELPSRLAAYWTITEDKHVTPVKAGENSGATLRHDFVVREYLPVAAWDAKQPVTLQFESRIAANPAHPRTVNLVVIDARSGRPVQAVKAGC
jgi:hypothetical protein